MPDEIHTKPISEEEDIAPYRLTAPLEIAFILRNLLQAAANVAIYFNAGRDMMLTRILDVDSKSRLFIMDVGGHAPTNQALLQADRILFVGALDGVKIQFTSSHAKLTQFDGKAAFLMPFPADLIKLQRRDFFRLTTPITNPFTCELTLPSSIRATLPLHDISLGGVGIWLDESAQTAKLERGTRLPAVSFDFGPGGFAKIDIEVRNLHPVTLAQGNSRWLMGCSFLALPRSVEASLQRLIAHLERERKALTG